MDRSILCLELEVQNNETDDFSARERLERARLHRKEAIASCRKTIENQPSMSKKLSSCLDLDDCMSYWNCRETVSLRARAKTALSAIEGVRKTAEEGDSHKEAASACRDRYLIESLKAMGDPESKRLVEKLRAACRSLEKRRLSTLQRRIDEALAPDNPHPISDLSRICGEMNAHRGDQQPRSESRRPGPGQHRAIAELCREQWRLRSTLSRMRKIRNYLQPPGCAECALRACRSLIHAKMLLRSTLQSVRSLAQRFERLCRVDAPVFWIRNRLDRKQHPGPITCRRAKNLLGKARSAAPDDPMVQLTSCLVNLRCADRR